MITLEEIDAPIAAAEQWPAGIDTHIWATIHDKPSSEMKNALRKYRKDPIAVKL